MHGVIDAGDCVCGDEASEGGLFAIVFKDQYKDAYRGGIQGEMRLTRTYHFRRSS